MGGPTRAIAASVTVLYDEIGSRYTTTRGTDPRIATAIWTALGDAGSILNVGAGSGSYEPSGLHVVALEPSVTMIEQRRANRGDVVRAQAEAIPFRTGAFDLTMSVLSDHHWTHRRRGLLELRRVARRRVVIFTFDPSTSSAFWLTRDYLPSFVDLIERRYRKPGAWVRELRDLYGDVQIAPIPIPADCRDGFLGAFWRRPAAYLDPQVRAGISVFARLAPDDVAEPVGRLELDLARGVWHARNGHLLELDELDLGYRLVVASVDDSTYQGRGAS